MRNQFLNRFLRDGLLIEVKNSDQSLSYFELDYVLRDGKKQRIMQPDYSYWLNKELWTVHEALSLSLGLNSTMVMPYIGDELFHIPGAGFDELTNVLCERFDALRSSKLMETEDHCTYKTRKTPEAFIVFFSEHYPYHIPMGLWDEHLLMNNIVEICQSGRGSVRKRIERFNLFFNFMSYRIPNLVSKKNKIKGTVEHFISAFEEMHRNQPNPDILELGYFHTSARKKDLKRALKFKFNSAAKNKLPRWKEEWLLAGIDVAPLEFEGSKEDPWPRDSKKY